MRKLAHTDHWLRLRIRFQTHGGRRACHSRASDPGNGTRRGLTRWFSTGPVSSQAASTHPPQPREQTRQAQHLADGAALVEGRCVYSSPMLGEHLRTSGRPRCWSYLHSPHRRCTRRQRPRQRLPCLDSAAAHRTRGQEFSGTTSERTSSSWTGTACTRGLIGAHATADPDGLGLDREVSNHGDSASAPSIRHTSTAICVRSLRLRSRRSG